MSPKPLEKTLFPKTKKEAYDFLVRIGAITPGKRTLEGDEKERVLTMLRLIEPIVRSNNQHSFTEDYIVGKMHYQLHSLGTGDTILEEKEIE